MKEKTIRRRLLITAGCVVSVIALSCTALVYAAESQPEALPEAVTIEPTEETTAAETVSDENITVEEVTEENVSDETTAWVPLDFAVIVDTHPNERNEAVTGEMPDKIGGIPVEDLMELEQLFLKEYEAAKERLGVAHVDETKTFTPEVQALFDEVNAKSEELEEKYNYPTNEKTVELNALSDWLLEELEHTDYWKTTKEERELLSQAYREAMEVYDGARDEILNEITERKISDILCYN